jgi:hypothetical protein
MNLGACGFAHRIAAAQINHDRAGGFDRCAPSQSCGKNHVLIAKPPHRNIAVAIATLAVALIEDPSPKRRQLLAPALKFAAATQQNNLSIRAADCKIHPEFANPFTIFPKSTKLQRAKIFPDRIQYIILQARYDWPAALPGLHPRARPQWLSHGIAISTLDH